MRSKKSTIKTTDIALILASFRKEYGITIKELRSIDRKPEHFFARMIFTKLVFNDYSMLAITRFLGLASHSTIDKYIKNYESDLKSTPKFIEMHQRITQYIKNRTS